MSLSLSVGGGSPQRFEYSQLHMGVRVRIVLYANREEQAEHAAQAAFSTFAELDAIMSDYRLDSELNQLCSRAGTGPIEVSEPLFAVLQRAKEVARRTAGAFDPTVAPLVLLWREAWSRKSLPSKDALIEARTLVGWHLMQLNPERRTVEFLQQNMKLDLGGIAKGYACDQALAALRREGVDSALVEAGGDIALGEPPPNSEGWVISLPHNRKRLTLSRCGVSTSGGDAQFVEIAGVRYSHILNPHTGYGVTEGWTVTVIGPDAFTTDPLATALCVSGDRLAPMLQAWAGIQVIWSRSK